MQKKNLLAHMGLTLLALLLTFCASKSSLFQQFELKSLDFRFLIRGEQPAHPDVVVVGIDDASISRFGRWPWPRSYHGELLNVLSQNPPRTVGFDFLFHEKDEANPEYDQALIYYSQLLEKVVFASYFELPQEAQKKVSYLEKEAEKKAQDEYLLASLALGNVEGDVAQLSQAVNVSLPFSDLLQAGGAGFINSPRDEDGVVRRVPLVLAYKGNVYPSFTLQLLMNYWKVKSKDVSVIVGKGVKVKKRDGKESLIPTDEKGNLVINFIGDHSSFNEALFVQVLNSAEQVQAGETPDIELEQFWKKIVLVALTATGTTDMGAFPLSGHSPLISIHANALDTILKEDYLTESSPLLNGLILVSLALIVFLLSSFLSPLKSAMTASFLLMGFVVGNYFLFLKGFCLPIVLPILLWVLTNLLITTFRYFTEEKEKKYVRKAFGQYVSANILEELLRDPKKLKLGGERRELTVLFSDIRGFTTFCESREPEEVVEMLNEYLDKMTEVIFKNNGTLDKYVGDAIVAFFGAPSAKEETEHPFDACRAALEMIQELKVLQQKWKDEGKEPLDIGIGLNTGPVLVGNMGSNRKFDYTVIGDNVNLGARLEGLTRKYECDIVISEFTYQVVHNTFLTRRLDEVTVKGKNKPVVVYELLP